MGWFSKVEDIICTTDVITPINGMTKGKTIEIWADDVSHVESLMDRHNIRTYAWQRTGDYYYFSVDKRNYNKAVRLLGR